MLFGVMVESCVKRIMCLCVVFVVVMQFHMQGIRWPSRSPQNHTPKFRPNPARRTMDVPTSRRVYPGIWSTHTHRHTSNCCAPWPNFERCKTIELERESCVFFSASIRLSQNFTREAEIVGLIHGHEVQTKATFLYTAASQQ